MLKKEVCVQIKRADHVLYKNIKKQCILVIFMTSKDKNKMPQSFKIREGRRKEKLEIRMSLASDF